MSIMPTRDTRNTKTAPPDLKQALIDFYLVYLNDYLTVKKYAGDLGYTVELTTTLVDLGRQLWWDSWDGQSDIVTGLI